jgi:hypothetical protein
VGAGARLRMERFHVSQRRCRRAPGGVAVGAGARLPVNRYDVRICRRGQAPGDAAVGERARLPVGQVHAPLRAGTWRC